MAAPAGMYAKFDKICAELSDDDEPARPTVTRLAGPTRVTIGPDGAGVAAPPPQWEPRPDPTVGPVRARARLRVACALRCVNLHHDATAT